MKRLNNYFYFDPIKIESPEQFVPLFLAKDGTMKDEYRFIIRNGNNNSNNSLEFYDYSTRQLADAFLGRSGQFVFHNSLIDLGLIIDSGLSSYGSSALKSSSLYERMDVEVPNFAELSVSLLIVVKAKHLDTIRNYSGGLIQLPLSDIKWLYNQYEHSITLSVFNDNRIKNLKDSQDPIVEKLSSKSLRRYLFPEFKTKSKSQHFEDALAVSTEVYNEYYGIANLPF